MGLRPWQTCSGVRVGAGLPPGRLLPFRQAARLLSDLVGTPVDHRRLWGWLQKAGRSGGRSSIAPVELFEEGLARRGGAGGDRRGGAPPPRGRLLQAKVAAAFTGKRVVSEGARYRKRICTGKRVLAGIYSAALDLDGCRLVISVEGRPGTGPLRGQH